MGRRRKRKRESRPPLAAAGGAISASLFGNDSSSEDEQHPPAASGGACGERAPAGDSTGDTLDVPMGEAVPPSPPTEPPSHELPDLSAHQTAAQAVEYVRGLRFTGMVESLDGKSHACFTDGSRHGGLLRHRMVHMTDLLLIADLPDGSKALQLASPRASSVGQDAAPAHATSAPTAGAQRRPDTSVAQGAGDAGPPPPGDAGPPPPGPHTTAPPSQEVRQPEWLHQPAPESRTAALGVDARRENFRLKQRMSFGLREVLGMFPPSARIVGRSWTSVLRGIGWFSVAYARVRASGARAM